MPEESNTVRLNVSPEVAELAQREARRGVRWRNAPVAALGFAGFLGGINFFVHPEQGAAVIGRSLGPWDQMWNAAFLVGGLLIMIGSLRPWSLVEVFGWAVFVPALVAYSVAVFALVGTPPSVFLGVAWALAGISKIVYLMAYAPRVTRIGIERRRRPGLYGGKERRTR